MIGDLTTGETDSIPGPVGGILKASIISSTTSLKYELGREERRFRSELK